MKTEAGVLGEVECGKAYTLERFMAVTGLRRVALDTARKNGLLVRKLGRRCFIFGQDFIDHITSPKAAQS